VAFDAGRELREIDLCVGIGERLIDETLIDCHFILRQGNIASYTFLVSQSVSVLVRLFRRFIGVLKNSVDCALCWNALQILGIQPTSVAPDR